MKLSNILWGVVLICLGVIIGLNVLEVTNIDIFFSGWWTLFIIVPSFIDLFKEKDKTGSLIGLLIGISLLLACQGIISFGMIWKLAIPVLLVVIGLSLIFNDVINNKIKKKVKELNTNNGLVEYPAIFGGQDLNFSDVDFEGCNLTAVFGGIKCDLKDAKIKEDVLINVTSVFGGIDIIVPEDVVVKITSFPLFGGVSDNRKVKNIKSSKKTIYINATCMFGGVEIK